jgi:hypothetical protein
VDAIGPQEARLLALERKQVRLDDYMSNLARQLTALEQGIWQAWSELSGAHVTSCTATYSGYLLDCTSAGFVGYVVTVMDSTTSAVLGTATTGTGGAFSGTVDIESPSRAVEFITTGVPNYQDLHHSATLSCGSNAVGNLSPTPIIPNAPTLTALSNQTYCGDPGTVTISLTGITDGNANTLLPITITATSTSTFNIPTPGVTYTSPNSAGSIQFTPRAGLSNCGSPVTISVAVTNSGSTTCGGSNKLVRTFQVVVVQPSTPTLNNPGNLGPIAAGSAHQTVSLSGIGPGIGETCLGSSVTGCTISASSSAPSVAGIVSTSGPTSGGTGTLVISIGSAGTATITVTVTDPNASHCGTNRFSRTFTVTVV